jgi:hypothetical protein
MDVCLLWVFVCCQVEVSAANWSLAQRSPTDCGASFVWSRKPRKWGGHSPRWAAAPCEKKNWLNYLLQFCCSPTIVTWDHTRNENEGHNVVLWAAVYLQFKCVLAWWYITVMRRISTSRSTMDRIHESCPISLKY